MIMIMIHSVVRMKPIKLSIDISLIDCSWSEQDYQLAWWAWKKWRYHQMTSLRVSVSNRTNENFPAFQ